MKPTTTWILIADGARARIFLNRGPGKGVEPVAGTEIEADVRPGRDVLADRPGRAFESAGTMRHAIEPRQDPRREQKREFAGRLAAMLDERLAEKAYDRLVLVASPATLGDLRAALSAPVRALISAELDKDLTNTPAAELPRHLAEVLAV